MSDKLKPPFDIIFRLSLIAKTLNVGVPTIIQTLSSKGYKVDANPNAKLNNSQLLVLAQAFNRFDILRIDNYLYYYEKLNFELLDLSGFDANEIIANKQKIYELNVKKIKFSSAQIKDFSFLIDFDQLQSLDLSGNQISDINFLAKLTDLKSLDLSRNQISDISCLASLTGLQTLDLSDNQILDYSFLKSLKGLQFLGLNFYVTPIPYNRISDISFLASLTGLRALFLSFNQISDYSFLASLTGLQILDLSRNQISDIRFLASLTGLQALYLSSNKISDISFLASLMGLQTLDLSSNQISDISLLASLTDLQSLYLNYNQISDIKPLLPLLKKELQIDLEDRFRLKNKIGLKNNPITNPPFEVVQQGSEAVIRYFEKIEQEGTDFIYEAKLTLVGDGGSGKTSLQNRIIDKEAPLPKSEDRTRGIKVSKWLFSDQENISYTVNIWDFGGQDVYYPVHRFFLTENSVYVLMASTRILSHNFEYWIPTIYQFGGASPIILVQTCHDNNRSHWNDLGIFYSNSSFKILKPHFELNLPNQNEGLGLLENTIQQQIIQLPHIGKPVPKSWVKVREALSEKQKEDACISYEKFVEICQGVDTQNFKKPEDTELLGRFFADLGIILWYHDKEYLKNWVILQPQWAMNAVYKIIDDIEVQNCGIIHKNDFQRLWDEQAYREKHELLKKMLQVFKIAFPQKHSSDDYILPARLNSLPDEKRWTNTNKTIRLQYDFDFMPRGIVNQVSAELSRYIKTDSEVWNNAVNFEFNRSEVQVEEDYFKRHLYIKAKGQDARSFVVLIMVAIENILADYRGVKPTIQVPCSCDSCQQNENPTFFSYKKLIVWSQTKQSVVCNESSTTLSIQSLLYNAGLELEEDKVTHKKEEYVTKMRNDESKIHIEFKPEITVNPTFTNTQSTPPLEAKKEELKGDKSKENQAVKKWQRNALVLFVVSLVITILLAFVYHDENERIMSKENWKSFKESDLLKWIGIVLAFVWNGFIGRMAYDRFFDHSKEKAFRDTWKVK